MNQEFQIRNATYSDLKHIKDLQNHHILHTDDIYSEDPKSDEEVLDWYESQKNDGFPIIVAEINGAFAGFANYGQFRKRPCYSTTVEHSVYLTKENRSIGLGSALMNELFDIARKNKIHAMMGGIDSKNRNSIDFHTKMGFEIVGRIPEVAYKKGRWLELVLMQKIL